jgi:hypothetical protein
VAVLSRVTDHLGEHGVEASAKELYICETFCTRAAARVKGVLDQVELNDDERMVAIAELAYQRGDYGRAEALGRTCQRREPAGEAAEVALMLRRFAMRATS